MDKLINKSYLGDSFLHKQTQKQLNREMPV